MEAISLDYKVLTFWWNVVQTILTAGIAIYVWISNKHKANRESIESVEDRVLKLEETVKHMPSKSELAVLHKRITEVAETQKRIEGEFSQTNRTLGMIHEYLLHRNN